MNWYLYKFGYAISATSISDSTYNNRIDRPVNNRCFFKDEHEVKNLPVIDIYNQELGSYVLIECPMDDLLSYLDSIEITLFKDHDYPYWSTSDHYAIYVDRDSSLHTRPLTSDTYEYFSDIRPKLFKPQQLVFR